MCLFIAKYDNMDTNEEIIRKIEFDGQYLTERQTYMWAMSKAYDMKQKNECLGIVEFIEC